MKKIIYPTDEGTIAVVALSPSITLDSTVAKYIPLGKPFKIVDASDLPTDVVFYEAWVVDFTENDGLGEAI